jgi:hypothetical protein
VRADLTSIFVSGAFLGSIIGITATLRKAAGLSFGWSLLGGFVLGFVLVMGVLVILSKISGGPKGPPEQ